MKLEQKSAGRIRVAHVPKTIDNDLDPAGPHRHLRLPDGAPLRRGARQEPDGGRRETTSRWYFVIAIGQGRAPGARHRRKASGATLTLVPEEFGGTARLAIVDTLVGAVVKRLASGRRDGVAIIAEGWCSTSTRRPRGLQDVERDAHGNVRIAEVDIGEILKKAVAERLKQFKIKTDDHREEHRLRAALRRPPCRSTWSTRAIRPLRGGTCSAAATRGDGVDAGRAVRAGSLRDLLDAETGRRASVCSTWPRPGTRSRAVT